MIPTFEAVEASYAFLARRFGFQGTLQEAGVRSALDLARSLAEAEEDEPAAIFFAMMRHPKALGGATRALPALLAFNTARARGLRLNATSDECAASSYPPGAVHRLRARRRTPREPPEGFAAHLERSTRAANRFASDPNRLVPHR